MKVYLWGIGKGCDRTLISLRLENIEILGIIDNNPALHGEFYKEYQIYAFEDIRQDYDCIIVTNFSFKAVQYQLQRAGVDSNKVICFHDINGWGEQYGDLFDIQLWKIGILEQRLCELERTSSIRLRNMRYEIAADIDKGTYFFPIIRGREEAVERIVKEKKSLIRFGDGEFEIMAGKNRAVFQRYEEELSKRLIDVVQTEDSRILIAIADNYGSLDKYEEEAADAIRDYMTEEVRAFHSSILSMDRVYYDAYMFRCYFLYKDKSIALERVKKFKEVWQNRDVILIEGAETRAGIGNDLFDNVRSLKRILCPTQNAYACYDEILETALQIDKNALILSILGPAGKVLSYDLVQQGYQVVDIGQIDMDYEWYLAGQGIRVPIANKYVSQLPPAVVGHIQDPVYEEQVIARIGYQENEKNLSMVKMS